MRKANFTNLVSAIAQVRTCYAQVTHDIFVLPARKLRIEPHNYELEKIKRWDSGAM